MGPHLARPGGRFHTDGRVNRQPTHLEPRGGDRAAKRESKRSSRAQGYVCQLRQERLHPARHLRPGEPGVLGGRAKFRPAVHPDGHVEGVCEFHPSARPVVVSDSPNTGFYSSLDTFVPTNPRIFIIPRYPTNLVYNVSTPAEWVSEYNYFYGSMALCPRLLASHRGLAAIQATPRFWIASRTLLCATCSSTTSTRGCSTPRTCAPTWAGTASPHWGTCWMQWPPNTRPCTTCRS